MAEIQPDKMVVIDGVRYKPTHAKVVEHEAETKRRAGAENKARTASRNKAQETSRGADRPAAD